MLARFALGACVALLAATTAAAMTSDIEKYLKVKPVSAVLQSQTNAAELEACLSRHMTRLGGAAPLIYKADGKTTVAVARMWISATATFDPNEERPRIVVRGKLGRMAARQCADEVTS